MVIFERPLLEEADIQAKQVRTAENNPKRTSALWMNDHPAGWTAGQNSLRLFGIWHPRIEN
jgi:hypothetical protein